MSDLEYVWRLSQKGNPYVVLRRKVDGEQVSVMLFSKTSWDSKLRKRVPMEHSFYRVFLSKKLVLVTAHQKKSDFGSESAAFTFARKVLRESAPAAKITEEKLWR